MRNMIKQVLDFAAKCPHIRIVGMEGSRTNKNVPKDEFQDFDITYFVDDIGCFTQNDNWLTYFGTIIMMQKPEDMELFPPEQPGYSYLILFDDYCKLDRRFWKSSKSTTTCSRTSCAPFCQIKTGSFLNKSSLRTQITGFTGPAQGALTTAATSFGI